MKKSPRASGLNQGLSVLHEEPYHGIASPTELCLVQRLKVVARDGGNVFEELMETVKVASLGQITEALFEVGGAYRRSM